MALSETSLLELLGDTFLKDGIKDELFADHNYVDDVITVSPAGPRFSATSFAPRHDFERR